MMKISVALIIILFHLATLAQTYQGHGADSLSKEILNKYAPGALPPDLSRKIQNYLDIRSPGLGLLHPNTKQLFFSWKVTGTNQIWRVDGPKSFPTQMTGGEDPTTLEGITKNGKYLILSRDRSGEENPGLYIQSTSGGSLEIIQHLPKIQTQYQGQSDDGIFLYFRANDKDPNSYAIYRYSLKERKKELIFAKEGTWSIVDIRPNGKLLLSRHYSNVKNEIYELEQKSGKLQPLFGQNEDLEYRIVYGPNENEFFIIAPKNQDFRSLFHWKNGTWTQLSNKNLKADIDGLAIDKKRTHVFYTVNDKGYSRVQAFDAKTLKPIDFPSPKNADHVYFGKISDDGTFITLGIETSKAPKDNYVYNIKTKKLVQWISASSPEVNTAHFAQATLESYPAQDGTEIPMFVRRPEKCPPGKEMNCSVIVHFHGGPEAQTVPGFSVFAQIFIDAGFIFAEPNVRGSDGYGQSWLNSDNGPKRLKVITDIEDASKFIKQKWGSKKIGVFGGSYGGYSVLYAMTKFAGSYDAGVEIVGISNLVTFLMNTAPYRRALRVAEYGDPIKDKIALTELSPITHLDKVKSPILMIQGANDPRVPVGEALQIAQAMEKKSIPNELIIFADEGHGAAKRSNQVIQIGRTLQFFEKYLQEAPAPQKH